jgi:hypothetical protein
MFRTRQLVLDPPTEIDAASSISARGCLRLSSIFLLVHPWPQSKVKLLLVGTTNENPPDGGHRAGTLAELVRDTRLRRFVVRRDARLNWMVWDRDTKGPAMFQGRFVIGLAEDDARVVRDELTKRYIAGE